MVSLKKIASEWNRNALARCRQLDEGKDISHHKVLVPTILDLAGRLRGKEVLDLGCGCGFLSSIIAFNAKRVMAIDISTKMISEARKRFGTIPHLEFRVLSIEALAKSRKDQFDVCLSNMSIVTMPYLDKSLASISKVLKPGGRLVFSITHPCFWNVYRKDEPVEKFNYWTSHSVTAPFRITLDQEPLPSSTTYFHRPIGEYVRSLTKAGFHIETIVEPKAPPSAPSQYRQTFTLPRFMVLSVCRSS